MSYNIGVILRDVGCSILNYCRLYSKQAIIRKSKNREKRLLNKMIGGSGSRKRVWYDSETVRNTSEPLLKLPRAHDSRRMTMLNKVFMRQITDMMASGEVAEQIVGRGLQISRVKISVDFRNLSVYWLSQNPTDDGEIEKVLKSCAGHLRHELSQLQVVGSVPRIEFVKDTQFTRMVDVDYLLAQADFGDDYTPVHSHYYYNANFTQNPEAVATAASEKPLPAMRMNVLGLDHAAIMNRVQKGLKKAQAQHRKEPYLVEIESCTTDVESKLEASSIESSRVDRVNFSKYLRKREAERERAIKQAQRFRPEVELYEPEQTDSEKYLESFLSHIEDKDFMDDDDDDGYDGGGDQRNV